MVIKTNQSTKFNNSASNKLRELLQFPILVIDTETSGNYVETHGLLSLAAMDLFNPNLNYYGECHLRDGAQISQFDIAKNDFGKGSNLTRIINPSGNYPYLRDPTRPFIQPNHYDIERYLELERLVRSILNEGNSGKEFIGTSVERLASDFFNWIKDPKGNDSKKLTFYTMDSNGLPVITPLGQNTSFDVGYCNDAFRRAGIGVSMDKVVQWSKDNMTNFNFLQKPFTFAYRMNIDIGNVAADYLTFKCNPDDVKNFWGNSKSNKGQNKVIPYIGGQSGLSLDAVLELTGLPLRPNPMNSSKAHDALEDVELTLEAYARIMTGMKYLEKFEEHDVGRLVNLEYRNQ